MHLRNPYSVTWHKTDQVFLFSLVGWANGRYWWKFVEQSGGHPDSKPLSIPTALQVPMPAPWDHSLCHHCPPQSQLLLFGFWAPATLLSSKCWRWRALLLSCTLEPLSTAGLPCYSRAFITITVSLFLVGSWSFLSWNYVSFLPNLLLRRKAMTNLDSALKSRNITLLKRSV